MGQTDLGDLEKLNANGNGQVAVICKNLDKTCLKSQKPLGERKKAVWRQEWMVFLGNTGVLGGGMAVALPSVTLSQLTDTSQPFFLTNEQTSWFCKSLPIFLSENCLNSFH